MSEVPVQQNIPQAAPTHSGFNWKKVLIVVLIGAVLIGVGVGLYYLLFQPKLSEPAVTTTKKTTPSAQKPETANWKLYTNNNLRYSFKYPPTYVVSETPYGSDMVTGSYNPQGGDSGGFSHIYVIVADNPDNLTIEQFAATVAQVDAKLTFKDTVVDGLPAKRTSDIYRANQEENVFVRKGSKIFQIELAKGEIGEIIDIATFDKVLSTFKFLD